MTRSHPGAEYKLDLHDCISTIRIKMNEIHQKDFIIHIILLYTLTQEPFTLLDEKLYERMKIQTNI